MKICTPHFTLGMIAAAIVTLTACGGGGGSDAVPVATTPVTPTVLDGLIENALVCADSNDNGTCETSEIQGRTGPDGKVTLHIPTSEITRIKLIAMVGVDARDADSGAVKTAFTLRTSAGKHSVISPLTDAVQTKLDLDPRKTFETAENEVKTELGLRSTVSVTDNFIEKRDKGTLEERTLYKSVSDKAREHVLKLQTTSVSLAALQCEKNTEKQSSNDLVRKSVAKAETSSSSVLDTDDDIKTACSTSTSFSQSCDDAIKSKVARIIPAASSCPPPGSASSVLVPAPAPASTSTADAPVVLASAPAPVTPDAPTPAAAGKAVYAVQCAACHTATPALNVSSVLRGANSASAILNTINSNKGGMGSLKGITSTQNANDLAAYLATPGI